MVWKFYYTTNELNYILIQSTFYMANSHLIYASSSIKKNKKKSSCILNNNNKSFNKKYLLPYTFSTSVSCDNTILFLIYNSHFTYKKKMPSLYTMYIVHPCVNIIIFFQWTENKIKSHFILNFYKSKRCTLEIYIV